MPDFINDDNAAVTLLSQFEIVKDFIRDLQQELEQVERELTRPKLNAETLKKMVNSAALILIQMKSFCP